MPTINDMAVEQKQFNSRVAMAIDDQLDAVRARLDTLEQANHTHLIAAPKQAGAVTVPVDKLREWLNDLGVAGDLVEWDSKESEGVRAYDIGRAQAMVTQVCYELDRLLPKEAAQ